MLTQLAQQLVADINRFVEAGKSNAENAMSQDQMKLLVERALAKTGLVTREEFDAQAAVLRRTREKLDALEVEVRALEEAAAKPAAKQD